MALFFIKYRYMYLILSAEKPRALENIKVDKQLFEKK